MLRVGVLMPENNSKSYVAAFTHALAELGWTDGRNVRMDLRWCGADTNRARALAHELVGLQLDIFLTSSTPATAAVQQETRTIPIVFVNVGDPVVSGLVTSLNRPGGNIIGFATFEPSLGASGLSCCWRSRPGSREGPDRYVPSTFFDTMPSAPSRHALGEHGLAILSDVLVEQDAELLTKVETFKEASAKQTMREIAVKYENLAAQLEKAAADKP